MAGRIGRTRALRTSGRRGYVKSGQACLCILAGATLPECPAREISINSRTLDRTGVTNMKPRDPTTPEAIRAVFSGDLEAIRLLIASKPQCLSDTDRLGRTAMHYAAQSGQDEAIALLAGKGVSVSLADKNGETPLHSACRDYRVSSVDLLIRLGSKVDALDRFGNSPLSLAVFESRGRPDVIRRLIAAGADKNLKNKSGVSPLDLAETIGNYDLRPFLE